MKFGVRWADDPLDTFLLPAPNITPADLVNVCASPMETTPFIIIFASLYSSLKFLISSVERSLNRYRHQPCTRKRIAKWVQSNGDVQVRFVRTSCVQTIGSVATAAHSLPTHPLLLHRFPLFFPSTLHIRELSRGEIECD